MSDVIIPKIHYDNMVNAASQLRRMCEIYGQTADDEFESYVAGSVAALEEALKHVPGSTTWDGVFRSADVTVDEFRHDTQPDHSGPPMGVKVTHNPTGLSVESYSKSTRDLNERSALTALETRVKKLNDPPPPARGHRQGRRVQR